MTIEQRAFASLETRKREQIDNNAPKEKFIGDVYINGYYNGAKEQRKIDINNAITFLRQYGEGDFSCWEEFEYVFRKAIEK